jgi:hypothetical protein
VIELVASVSDSDSERSLKALMQTCSCQCQPSSIESSSSFSMDIISTGRLLIIIVLLLLLSMNNINYFLLGVVHLTLCSLLHDRKAAKAMACVMATVLFQKKSSFLLKRHPFCHFFLSASYLSHYYHLLISDRRKSINSYRLFAKSRQSTPLTKLR